VVDDHRVADLNDLAVHFDPSPLTGLGGSGESCYIVVIPVSDREPLMVPQSLVVIGIDFCVPRPGEGNSAECVAVARPAPAEDEREQEAFQPARKVKCDIDLDIPPPRGKSEIRSTKSETMSNLKWPKFKTGQPGRLD